MNEKTVNINNFIGVYDNYITKEECNKAIKLYEDQNKFNKTFSRINSEKSSILYKQDQQFFAGPSNINIWWEELKPMIVNFDLAWSHYAKNVGAIDAYGGEPFHYADLKIQKTLPTEGYHVWHVELAKGYDNEKRAFVFSIYLIMIPVLIMLLETMKKEPLHPHLVTIVPRLLLHTLVRRVNIPRLEKFSKLLIFVV